MTQKEHYYYLYALVASGKASYAERMAFLDLCSQILVTLMQDNEDVFERLKTR